MTIVDQSVDLAVDSDDESVDIFVLSFGETVIKIEDKNVFLKKIKYQRCNERKIIDMDNYMGT